MKPFDIVKTPKGAYGIITETNDNGTSASVRFFGGGNPSGEKNAWWSLSEGLQVVDSLPRILALATAHPFGTGREDVERFFPLDNHTAP